MNGAEDGTRTRDPHLGKVMLYQLSHFRSGADRLEGGAEGQDRTGDTAIFSRVLYRLSYLGPMANRVGCPSADRRIPRPSEGLPWPGRCDTTIRDLRRRPTLPYSRPTSRACSASPKGGSPVS